jgi:fatty acid desaturase
MNPVTMQYLLAYDSEFSLDDVQMRSLVRDLNRADPVIYWLDLLITCTIGWSAFVAAVVWQPLSLKMVGAVAVAVLALYRALCFMHELTHQNRRTLPGFETAWNWLVGFPLLMPSFVYIGVHQDHHKVSSYGTTNDPEYLPFAHSSRMTTVFALESFFLPLALAIRFVLLTPVGLVSRRFQTWLVTYASALTMNVLYRRTATADLIRSTRRDGAFAFAIWAAAATLAFARVIPFRVFIIWLVVDSLISFINTLRTLGAHAYENDGEPLDRTGQLIDSIDTPGAFWTELWAPVGLRYHALHHYFPGIPYHSLPQAYRRVVQHLPVAGSYKKMTSRSLPHSLRTLYLKGLHEWKKVKIQVSQVISTKRAG